MNFLNATSLFGLLTLLVPILLHLQKKKIKTVDWAAVRFLQQTIINRRRGLTWEHFLLLLCRCFLLAAFVFAIARPWTENHNPTHSVLPWLLLLVGIATLLWSITWISGRFHRTIVAVAGLTMCCTGAGVFWFYSPLPTGTLASPCDVVLIIDGSDSMGIDPKEKNSSHRPPFAQALDFSNELLDALPERSTAAVIVIGAERAKLSTRLQSNLHTIRDRIGRLEFRGGVNNLAAAIDQARAILMQGTNARQKIVLCTDDQLTNWQSLELGIADELSAANADADYQSNTTPAGIIARIVHQPTKLKNLAVTKIDINEESLFLGETLKFAVEIFNGGTDVSETSTLEILLDDAIVQSIAFDSIAVGTRLLIAAEIKLPRPGHSIMTARIESTDDLPTDNVCHRALAVHQDIPVLIIDGGQSYKGAKSAAHYLYLALNSRLVRPEKHLYTDLPSKLEFKNFRAIFLCDCPQLDQQIASRLTDYVSQGGGLVTFLGPACNPEFYNAWRFDSRRLLPLEMREFETKETGVTETLGLDWASAQHPVFSEWIESGEHDLSEWNTRGYWSINLSEVGQSHNRETIMHFTNGHPLWAEHSIGRGRVIAQTTIPHPAFNNFINRVGFPVLQHLLTRRVFQTNELRMHHQPSPALIMDLPMEFDTQSATNQVSDGNEQWTMRDPRGNPCTVNAVPTKWGWQMELGPVTQPGIYTLHRTNNPSNDVPLWRFTVQHDPSESDLSLVSQQQLESIAHHAGIKLITEDDEWFEAATGVPIKHEWWLTFAHAVLIFIVLESVVLLWIATQRGQAYSRSTLVFAPLAGVVAWLICSQIWQLVSHLGGLQYARSIPQLATIVAVLVTFVSATYWEGSIPRSFLKPTPMKIARFAQIGLIGFVLLEPTRTEETEKSDNRQVVILWDRSNSMSLVDDDLTRDQIAWKLLKDGLDNEPSLISEISKAHSIQLYEYAASPKVLDDASLHTGDDYNPSKTSLTQDQWGEETKLAAAIQRVLSDHSAEELSSVIVLTDGCDFSAVSPTTTAAELIRHKIPVHAVVIGNQDPIIDAAVTATQSPSQIYLDDQLTVNSSLQFDQLRGKTATVHLYCDKKRLQSKTVKIPNDQYKTTVQFEDLPRNIGLHHYRISIDPIPGERVKDNNDREISVWVTNDRLRLLIIEQRPRWEFRYLKNLFAGRDRNVALQHVLLTPDRLAGVPAPFPMIASASRAFDDCEANQLPETENEWLKFDVIILGDIEPSELTDDQQLTIEKFVSQRGGTLIIIAGPQSMPHQFFDRPLGKLLPVQRAPYKESSADTIYRVRLTKDGLNSPLIRHFTHDRNQSDIEDKGIEKSIWDRLPNLYWRHANSTAKPGATVLAWAEEIALTNRQDELRTKTATEDSESARKQALILWQRYGGGRVLQMNFDQTWRLRYWNGDEYHHRFWGKVMRWSTEDRLGLGTELVRLGIDRTKYKVADPMTIKVRLVDDQPGTPNDPSMVRLKLTRLVDREEPDREEIVSETKLESIPDSGGLLQARMKAPDHPGRYRLYVAGPDVERLLAKEKKSERRVFAEFTVDAESKHLESNDLVASNSVVGPLTQQTGGLLLTHETAGQLLEQLNPQVLERQDQTTEAIWDRWPISSLFLTLILGEWIIRKRRGLI